MQKIIVLFVFMVFHAGLSAQENFSGKVLEKGSGLPVASASVLVNGQIGTSTEADGSFSIRKLKKGEFEVTITSTGYLRWQQQVNTATAGLTVELERIPLFLQPVEVKAIRAGEKAPFTRSDISKTSIVKNNTGRDLPFLLDQTPSVVVNSDAGTGLGYTGIRIRGSDATRINVTINGIPYNDAESQGTFFVNLPDFASSLSSIQVQRGVGTSSNGAGAFGASINLATNEFNPKAYGELNNSIGSFNTRKHTVKAGSGLLGNHFTIDARFSAINSDGYIDRASSDLNSAYFSAAYLAPKASVRFNFFTGKEKTYQAWYGVPESLLKTNRRFNSAGTEKEGSPYDNETDNYQQDHYQLFYNQQLSSQTSFNIATYVTRGKGYFEQYKAGAAFASYGLPDAVIDNTTIREGNVIRQLWLDNYLYGTIFSLQQKTKSTQWVIGGGWNQYDGDHLGEVIWAQFQPIGGKRYYDHKAIKKDGNLYAKMQTRITQQLEAFADIQFRNVRYAINGFRNNPDISVDARYDFFNPKIGITYNTNKWKAYFSYAIANKEPNRDDFESGASQQPLPERLGDAELGISRKDGYLSYGATLYYMHYRNQLVLTGQVNDVGAYTRSNVPVSYRAGIELEGKALITSQLNATANITFSKNKLKEFTQYADDFDNGGQKGYFFSNTDIAFSPNITSAAQLNYLPLKNIELSLLGKYVGRQYLDNTQDKSKSLTDYFVTDFRAIYTVSGKRSFREINIIAQVNNLFSKLYQPNGYTFGYISGGALVNENFYFPMAERNFMLTLNISL
jgi:iron complex outermembrane recepter protein